MEDTGVYTIDAKAKAREEIEKATREFLDSGGSVEKVEGANPLGYERFLFRNGHQAQHNTEKLILMYYRKGYSPKSIMHKLGVSLKGIERVIDGVQDTEKQQVWREEN